MQSVRQDGGGVSVGEVEELEGNPFLVGSAADVVEEQVDEAGVAGPFGQAVILEGG